MSNSIITKQALAAALKILLEQMPFAKVRVSQICEKCGMSRKSFYYHFQDKYELVNWIFDTEMERFIEEKGVRQEQFSWEAFEQLCEYFYENRIFYARVLLIQGQNSFTEHLQEILVPVVRQFLRKTKRGGDDEEFYIHFYADAFMAALFRWLDDKNCMPPDRFTFLLQSSIEMLTEITNEQDK